jgi:D-aminopeptidase
MTVDEKKVDALFSALNQCHLPGAAVGIAIDGRPAYRKGFGLANAELPLVLSPSLRMRIGSTSKQFTAFTYLMLCEAGLADIDDPIGKFLPELHPVTHRVTMRQLMGNTSGLRDATDLAVQFSGLTGRRVTTDDLLTFYRDVDDVSFAPGATYNYNNGGWVLLGAVIEKITGQTLEEVMWERVFAPIGMLDTLLRRWDSTFIPNSASCHTMLSSGRYEKAETHGGVDYAGAGSVASTVDDMLRWMAHMDAPTVGTAKTWQLMKTPQILSNGISTRYGMGLQTSRYRGIENIQHGGGGLGSNVQMLKVPAARLDVIIMVNRNDAWSFTFAEQILDACLTGLETAAEPYRGPIVTGVFRSSTTGRIIHLYRHENSADSTGSVQMASIHGHAYPFEPDPHGVLRTAGYGINLHYTLTRVGDPLNPTAIQFEDFGNRDELTAMKPPQKDAAADVAGRYRSDTTGTEVEISGAAREATMSATGRFGSAAHHLECLAHGIWGSQGADELALPQRGVLAFDEESTEFAFSNAMNRNLRFRRIA